MGTSSANENHFSLGSPPPRPLPCAHTNGQGGGGLVLIERICDRIATQNSSRRQATADIPASAGGGAALLSAALTAQSSPLVSPLPVGPGAKGER